MPTTINQVLATTFERPRFEIIPMKGVDEQIDHLPTGAVVTVTSSPTKGINATLELTAKLQRGGCYVIPHVAARMVESEAQLAELTDSLDRMGVKEIFVIAGDANEPAGPFEGAAPLLASLANIGHNLEKIGVTGYPESHAFIPDDTTIQVMNEKTKYATHIVSQICYDAATIESWISAVRDRGVTLPIHIGLPGVVDRAKLMRISMKVGLGDSMRFLKKQSGVAKKLLSGYTPDELVESLAHLVDDERANIAGWHLFTFNEVEKTEQWRQQQLARFQGAPS